MNNRPVKVVLVHPPLKNIITGATPSFVDKNRGHNPPMGLLYMQAAIENTNKHQSVFVDANLEEWSHEETARKILTHNPDLIGIQAMTFTMPDVFTLVKEIRKLNNNVKIIIGGAHPTIYPEETAGLDGVDFAFSGEGEIAIPRFLDVFFDEDARSKIPGIACKINGNVHYTPSEGLLKNLDDVPLPARRSVQHNRYSSVIAKRNPITIMMTSRGCPFNCIFCNRMGRQWRWHSAEYVLREIEDIAKLGIKEIFIHDDTFSLKRDRIVAICNGLIERKLDITWEARTRVDCVDEELLRLMKKAGCHRLSFGVESGSERVILSMRKGIKLDQVRRVFKWCKEIGIMTLADFMLGNKDEEREDMEKTFKLAAEINPDYIQYSILSMYPNTPIYKEAMDKGMIGDVWREFARNPVPGFKTPQWEQNFKVEELVKICVYAYRRFYFRPLFILKQLIGLRSFSKFKTMTRSAIGMLKGV